MRRLRGVTRAVTGAVVAAAVCSGGSVVTQARSGVPPETDAIALSREANAYARLPVAFVENRGQIDSRVRFYAQGSRFAFYVTGDAIQLAFGDPSGGVALALTFPGSRSRSGPEGVRPLPGTTNYLRGPDARAWTTGARMFAGVVSRDLWPGISLHLREDAGTLKYEFHVSPGADPRLIRLAYDGAMRVAIDGSGALAIDTPLGTLHDAAPISYQQRDGQRVMVPSTYVEASGRGTAPSFGIAVGAYDTRDELVIDPGVQYSTFLGGASHELAAGIKVDASGNAYIVGTTQSPDFPTRPGAFKRTGAAGNFSDVFVTKLNPSGTALVYSTFIGGSDFDFGRSIAIDASGNAYITGQTKSPSFPTTGGAFDRTFNVDTCPRCGIDQYDAFVTKLNASGSALVYSTFLGGFDIDDGMGIAVDGAGNAYVTGETGSTNFPTTAGAFARTRNGAFDAFVTKLNASGSALVYSTYLGGSAVDFGSHIAVNASGNAFVTGTTSSPEFPTTAGAFDTTANGGFDAFVTKLSASGSALVYSTFLGGSGGDGGSGLAVDAAGNAYVAGSSGSLDFPTTSGAFDTLSDSSDAFAAKIAPDGASLVYSTLFGGTGSDAATGVALDATGAAWVSGITNSTDFPVTSDGADLTFNGVADAFVAKIAPDGASLAYATYFGGTQSEGADDLAVGANGDVYLTGHTYSVDFPTTAGAFDTVFNGDLSIFWGDAFVTKLSATGGSTPPSTPPVPPAPTLLAPANNDTPPQPLGFDWTDVGGAVSYVIQIDDSSAFAAPLVRDESVPASQYATTDLPASTLFWRVRAVNTAGVAGAWSATRSVTPQPAPAPPTLSTFSTNPSTVVGGTSSSGTVVLSTPAPHGGALIALSSSQPAVVSVPATVLAAELSFTGTFTIATSAVTSTTVVTITAAYNGTTRTATLTVTPAAPAATLQTLTLSPASVTGGSASQGIVTLSGAAPSGGALVSLSSSAGAVASVPTTVIVPNGATTAVFTIATAAVTSSTAVTITAAYAGVTRTSGLTVTAAPPPPTTATLTVNASGRNGERVTSSPAGISVVTGSSGSAPFAIGTSVTLSVTNGRDAIWSGACSSGGKQKTCTFTLGGTASVTANVQ